MKIEVNDDNFISDLLDILTINYVKLDLGTEKINQTSEESFEIAARTENKILKKLINQDLKH